MPGAPGGARDAPGGAREAAAAAAPGVDVPGEAVTSTAAGVTGEAVSPAAYADKATGQPMQNLGKSPGEADGKDTGSLAALRRVQRSTIMAGAPTAIDGVRASGVRASGVRDGRNVRPRWRRDADVVVIGSGAAGISVALTALARGLRVLVVTKDLVGGATPLAQGGLAAALGAGDTPVAHAGDTLVAGAGLCEPGAVAALTAAAPGAIGWLTGLGARLETRDLRLEGGHSARRIVHSGDDATGAEVHRVLLGALLASEAEILDRTVALDLLLSGAGGERSVAGLLAGVIGADGRLEPGLISARAVVIAAGGLGQAFGTTTNPAGATGDGIALAARAGAVIRDLEFVQFHPTVLWLPGASGQCPLITEALRGAGAVLRELDGTPLMAGHDPRGDLAPRDVVAARMAQVIATAGAGHVWLDATTLGRGLLEDGFPTVTAACRKHGIDPVTDLIPVAPGAHYSCGGILADLGGQTTIPGLYAVGEAASTGVQGANRLASNSVTEAVIAGRQAGTAVADALSGYRPPDPGAHPATATALAMAAPATVTAPAGGPADRDRGPEQGFASGLGAERPFYPASPAPFSGRSGDRGSSTAGIAAHDPRSCPGSPAGAFGSRGARGEDGTANEPPAGRTRREAGRRELAQAMSRYAGVMRDADGLVELMRTIVAYDSQPNGGGSAPAAGGAPPKPSGASPVALGREERGEGTDGHVQAPVELAPVELAAVELAAVERDRAGIGLECAGPELELAAVEAANLRTVSLLIAAGALRRAESRGCHRRRDAAETAAVPRHTLAHWNGREFVVTGEAL
jgi:L-aspartate oxidase